MTLADEIAEQLREIGREAANPARNLEYIVALQRLVPLAQRAVTELTMSPNNDSGKSKLRFWK